MFLCEIWSGCIVCIFSYDRVEVLSGFINGLFLIVIGIFVFTEALGRLVEPPEVSTERLLVSINVWYQKNRRVRLWSTSVNCTLCSIFLFSTKVKCTCTPMWVEHHCLQFQTVSVLGLLVNLFGIVAFRSSHSHGHGGHGHSHGGGHGHSHGGGHNHGHSHGGEGHQDRNANMEGRSNRRTNAFACIHGKVVFGLCLPI